MFLLVPLAVIISAFVVFRLLMIGGRAFLIGGGAGVVAGGVTTGAFLLAHVGQSPSALWGVVVAEIVFLIVSAPVDRTARAEAEARHEAEMAVLREQGRRYRRSAEEFRRYRDPD